MSNVFDNIWLGDRMKRIFVVLVAVILLFNTSVFADEAFVDEERDILAAFSINPEFDGDSIIIKLSELSRASALSFSYNEETGFLYANDGKYGIFIKELDDNTKVDGSAITIRNDNGMQLAFPYRFKVFAYICRQPVETGLDQNILDPRSYYSGKDNISLTAEATLELVDGTVQFVLRNSGTSPQVINNENIAKILGNNMLLVNKSNTLDRSYLPDGLVYGKLARGRSTVNLRLEGEAIQQLNYMLETAYNEGISGMVITSAFRTFDKQTSLFNNKTTLLSRKMNRKTAMEEASKVVAIPGSSEHQTGLAADICSEGVGLVRNFANTTQGKWMESNSWRFGYIVRYQKEKTEITRIIYEPWHVRYVGNGHSEIMKTKNMCLEEYVEYLKDNSIIYFSDSKGDNYIVQYINREELDSKGMALSLQDNSTWSISNCTKDNYVLTIKL